MILLNLLTDGKNPPLDVILSVAKNPLGANLKKTRQAVGPDPLRKAFHYKVFLDKRGGGIIFPLKVECNFNDGTGNSE
jgi:hypothetical protein